MDITRQKKLIKILKENNELLKLVTKLSVLKQDKKLDIDKVINDLELPLNYHLFIKGNFSELMKIKYN